MNQQTKNGYLIRANEKNKCYGNGYPLYADMATVCKAILTGEYTFDPNEPDTREIPADIQYRDERLN